LEVIQLQERIKFTERGAADSDAKAKAVDKEMYRLLQQKEKEQIYKTAQMDYNSKRERDQQSAFTDIKQQIDLFKSQKTTSHL
jgi:hypothetical protein